MTTAPPPPNLVRHTNEHRPLQHVCPLLPDPLCPCPVEMAVERLGYSMLDVRYKWNTPCMLEVAVFGDMSKLGFAPQKVGRPFGFPLHQPKNPLREHGWFSSWFSFQPNPLWAQSGSLNRAMEVPGPRASLFGSQEGGGASRPSDAKAATCPAARPSQSARGSDVLLGVRMRLKHHPRPQTTKMHDRSV